MENTPDTPHTDLTMRMGAWKRGNDVGQYTDVDDPKWRDTCPYLREGGGRSSGR